MFSSFLKALSCFLPPCTSPPGSHMPVPRGELAASEALEQVAVDVRLCCGLRRAAALLAFFRCSSHCSAQNCSQHLMNKWLLTQMILLPAGRWHLTSEQ